MGVKGVQVTAPTKLVWIRIGNPGVSVVGNWNEMGNSTTNKSPVQPLCQPFSVSQALVEMTNSLNILCDAIYSFPIVLVLTPGPTNDEKWQNLNPALWLKLTTLSENSCLGSGIHNLLILWCDAREIHLNDMNIKLSLTCESRFKWILVSQWSLPESYAKGRATETTSTLLLFTCSVRSTLQARSICREPWTTQGSCDRINCCAL